MGTTSRFDLSVRLNRHFLKYNLDQNANYLLEMAPERVVVYSYLHFCTGIDDDDDDDDDDGDNDNFEYL